MIFGRRIKRQQAMTAISEPMVHKSTLMMTELLKTQLGAFGLNWYLNCAHFEHDY